MKPELTEREKFFLTSKHQMLSYLLLLPDHATVRLQASEDDYLEMTAGQFKMALT
jgi:hypothetical protein